MKSKIVHFKDIFNKNNPTSCLSTLRVFTDCHKCQTYLNAFNNKRENKLSCNPMLKPKIRKLMSKKRKLSEKHYERIERINEEIKKCV